MKRLLFYCKAPMNAVMFERPLRRLWNDPRLLIRFAGQGRGHGDAPGILQKLGIDGARSASNIEVRWRGWDAYVSPDIFMPARRAERRIQIFHGVSFKGKMYAPAIRRFSDLFLIGEDMRRRLIERGLFEEGDPALHTVGMPKLDAFFDGSLDRTAILRGIGADPGRPAVLYAPTWRPESSLYAEGMELIEHCAAGRAPWTLVVKLHDWHWDPATNPIDWREAISTLENPHVRFAIESNAVPSLFAADALVSDASSVANEYLLLNRPLVWIDVPDLIRKYEQTLDLEGWGRKTGRIARTLPAVLEAIEHALNEPEEHDAVRRAAAADIFYNPGRATEVFTEKLADIVGLENGRRA
jgi:CDP-glycerol glycerophosphotransferase